MNLLLVTGIFPPDIGGPATYVPRIAAALAERGHGATVITLADALDHDDRRYPFRVRRIRRQQPRGWRILQTVRTILQEAHRPDVIFANGLFLESALAARLAPRPLVMKIVGDWAWERATAWGWAQDGFEAFQERRHGPWVEALKALRTFYIRQADGIIVPSRYLVQWVTAWGVPEEKIRVVYNAVEPVDDVSPASIPLNTRIKVVTVGRLVPLKHVGTLIRVVASLPQVGLVVVGDGPMREALECLAEALGVAARIYFAGRRSREEVLALLKACHLFVLNSSHEGLPHVVLEAMAAGLPVVATDVGGTGEVIEHGVNGLLVEPGDYGALQMAIKHLLTASDRRAEIAHAALQMVVERFDWDTLIEKTACVLNEVAQSPES